MEGGQEAQSSARRKAKGAKRKPKAAAVWANGDANSWLLQNELRPHGPSWTEPGATQTQRTRSHKPASNDTHEAFGPVSGARSVWGVPRCPRVPARVPESPPGPGQRGQNPARGETPRAPVPPNESRGTANPWPPGPQEPHTSSDLQTLSFQAEFRHFLLKAQGDAGAAPAALPGHPGLGSGTNSLRGLNHFAASAAPLGLILSFSATASGS